MKKFLLITTLVAAVMFSATALYAQADSTASQSGTPPQGQGHGRGPGMSPEQRLQRMTKQLNLSEDQQEKMKPILQDEAQQMQSVRQDSSLSPQDRQSKMQQIRDNSMTQMKSILDPDQQKKLEEMSSRPHGGWDQAPPTPRPQ